MQHLRSALVALAFAGALLVGCSGGSTNGGSSAAVAVDGDQAFLDYARCMRDNGVDNFPDPVQRPGHNGLSLDTGDSSSNPAFPAASVACEHLIQSILDVKSAGARSQVTPERLDGLIAYARCMRDYQIPMLDPDPTDGHISLGHVDGIANDIGRRDPQFQVADTACRSKLPAGVEDDGTGPP